LSREGQRNQFSFSPGFNRVEAGIQSPGNRFNGFRFTLWIRMNVKAVETARINLLFAWAPG